MRIENLRTETKNDRSRVAATIIWEDCDRPAQDLYFETEQEFAQDLTPNPNAFLVASLIPALHYGEKRVFLDQSICPELRDNLSVVMGHVQYWYDWYDSNRRPVVIEAKTTARLSTPLSPRAGFFFSGGIDSLATLRANRLNFPLDHPGSIQDGLFIYGFDFGKSKDLDETEAYNNLKASLSKIAKDANVVLIPVYTNLRQELDSHEFWRYEYSGSALSAVAHAFAKRFSVVSVAAGLSIPNLIPSAQHPLMEPNCSSYDLKIRYDGLVMSRFEKTRLIADWDVVLRNLKVCNYIERLAPDKLNCGRCEKCIRTMLTLMSLGKLEQAISFPKIEITKEMLLSRMYPKLLYQIDCYRDLIPPLEKIGRNDLAQGLRQIIDRYYGKTLKEKFKRFDTKYLGNSMHKLKHLVPL